MNDWGLRVWNSLEFVCVHLIFDLFCGDLRVMGQ